MNEEQLSDLLGDNEKPLYLYPIYNPVIEVLKAAEIALQLIKDYEEFKDFDEQTLRKLIIKNNPPATEQNKKWRKELLRDYYTIVLGGITQ